MAQPIYTLFCFDVEDTWYEDDLGERIPRFLAEEMTRRGLRAHFLLIGDRRRSIRNTPKTLLVPQPLRVRWGSGGLDRVK